MKYWIKNARVYTGKRNGEFLNMTNILVEDGMIAKIGKVDSESTKNDIDLNGQYLMPGFINMHVHLPGSGSPKSGKKDSKKLVKLLTSSKCFTPIGVLLGAIYAKQELYSGVTTLRAVGGVSDYDTRLRDQINKGKRVGPRIYAANSAIATEGGHMVGTVAIPVKNEEEAISLVEKLVLQKVDLIKIMVTGGVLDAEVLGEPGVLKMPPEIIKAVTETAHKYHLPVAAHVESYDGVRLALENGVDTIEHGSDLDDETIALFKQNNASLICTISPALPIGLLPSEETGFDQDGIINSCVVAKNILHGAEKLLNTDVKIGLGTDTGCPFTTHYNFWRELEWCHSVMRISRQEALYYGTLRNAEILQNDKILGSVEEGKYADFVICEKDPMETFKNVKEPTMVIKEGKIYKNIKIKKDPYVEEKLDTLMDIDLFSILDNYTF